MENKKLKDRKYYFEKLTPTNQVNLGIYINAFDFVFKDRDIKNVAVSGAYSSGKSSVLESYKNIHKEKNFLHISLAHFQAIEEDQDIEESVLEGKILNQLMHQIPEKNIQQTNFKIKKKKSNCWFCIQSLIAWLFIMSTLYFLFLKSFKEYASDLSNIGIAKSLAQLLSYLITSCVFGAAFASILLYYVYSIIKIQKNKNVFHKVNVQGNEIEIFEEDEDSYFDKYLNEVLYLFENADADVIVFEDMDRFNTNRIFERLREVNTLVNLRRKKEKEPLRFFYLLRDDVFLSKDRTKFFDFIIPVIPVIDGSNSYDQIMETFEKDEILQEFNPKFLQGLSLYIDDMRLLKNINNEFLIYFNKLSNINIDYNKMLAMIAYKNLFPKDFSELQLNRGFVFTLFYKKNDFISEEKERLNGTIDAKGDEVKRIKEEVLESFQELECVYNDKRSKYYNKLSEEDEKQYKIRRQVIGDRENDRLKDKENEIQKIKNQLFEIDNHTLNEIITRDNIDKIFSITSKNDINEETLYHDVKGNKYFSLLKYLIRNGYIDESYSDYMTYFYENSISRIDKNFLLSITDKKAKEYSYRLENLEKVISRLDESDFDQPESLNFDLFRYLLKKKSGDDYKKYLFRCINQIKETKNFEFVGEFFNISSKEQSVYVKTLNQQWPEIFIQALIDDGLSTNQLKAYSVASIYNSSDDVIKAMNTEGKFGAYISNLLDYLAIEKPDIEKLIYGLKQLKVLFVEINYEVSNPDLFQAVYENFLYELNAKNIELVLEKIYGINQKEDILTKNYTMIMKDSESKLAEYVHENIQEYIDIVLSMDSEMISDKEECVIDILNNEDIKTEQKLAYIDKMDTEISSLELIKESSLWKLLMDRDVVLHSENNILVYFSNYSFDERLIKFVNTCENPLDFSEIEENIKQQMLEAVIRINDINDVQYKQIIVSTGYEYEEFAFEDIEDSKIYILINNDIIKMTEENLKFIREYYQVSLDSFIKKYMKEYIEIMTNELFSLEELLQILEWDISDDFKLSMLEFTEAKISIMGNNYSPEVCKYILKHNLEEDDLESLFTTFEKWDKSVQDTIFNQALSHMSMTVEIEKENKLSGSLKNKILQSNEFEVEVKVDLMIAMMPKITNKGEIIRLLETIKTDELNQYKKIFIKDKQPKLEINELNKKVLSSLKKNSWIKDYEEDSNREFYKITKNRDRFNKIKEIKTEIL